MSSKPTGYSQGHRRGPTPEKAAGIQRLFRRLSSEGTFARLEPLAPAAMLHAPAIPLAVTIVHAAHESVVPPASAAEPPHTRQDGEPALLAIVQGLVERVSRVRDALHRRRGGSHVVGALAQPRHRIIGLLCIP